jgi:8-oxo-dGTP pyrophosphatase MutT (NUDIX family)
MRVYWTVRRPSTHGSLVALWLNGQILLVKNSYVQYFSLPGGYVKSGESGVDAAIRELREELGLEVSPGELRRSMDESHVWEGKQERLEIYELNLVAEPRVQVDNREVVAAAFYKPADALRLPLFPLLRKHIEQKLGVC